MPREDKGKEGLSGQVGEKNRGTHLFESTGKEMTSLFSLKSQTEFPAESD